MDDQQRLNERVLANFEAGLKKLREGEGANLDEVLRQHVRVIHERVGAPPEQPGYLHPKEMVPELEAAACRAVMAFRAERWLAQMAYYPCGSPLERVLDMALRVVGEENLTADVIIAHCRNGRHSERPGYGADQISICHQHQIGVFRVDFLVTGYDYDFDAREVVRRGQVAVEVDGHEFHEKTKEQAQHDKARDREIQRAGYQVFRFTGSEVWRDPIGCAREAVDAAFGRPARQPEGA